MHESWDEFEFQPDWTTDCGVSCPLHVWKNPHRLIMGKGCFHFFSAVLDRILFILAGNDNINESLGELRFGEIWPLVSMVTDRV